MVESPILLGHDDVVRLVSMRDAITAIEDACKEQHGGGVVMGERQNLRFPGGWIRLMPAAMTHSGGFGYKEFHLVVMEAAAALGGDVAALARPTLGAADGAPVLSEADGGRAGEGRAHVRYTMHLFDCSDGRRLASMDANYLTVLRTGAAAAVATDRLAPPGASDLAVIGSGAEARSQLEAALAVRPITTARVYGRDRERRARFASDMSERFGLDIRPVTSPQEAVSGAHIVVAATLTDGTPALCGEWLEPGQHVTSIGSTMPTQREIDAEVWRRADCVVVDTLGLLAESGDALAANEAAAVDLGRVRELSELVVSDLPGRAADGDITLYKSVGTALQDIAVAELAYRRATATGVGLQVADLNSVKTVRPN